jgi:cyclopropane fatty-acyl-phospholipid synthase-like methyltransferase
MVEKDVVRRGYDGVADEYADRRSFDESERAILEEFLDALSPDPLLLDAGCGQGTPVLRALAERHPDSPTGAGR